MPAWSPDGREIAFVSDRRERGVYAQREWAGAPNGRLVADAAARGRRRPGRLTARTVAYTVADGADEPR